MKSGTGERNAPTMHDGAAENGVPHNHVAGCPNFPECMCTAQCVERRPAGEDDRIGELLIMLIIAGAIVAVWAVLS